MGDQTGSPAMAAYPSPALTPAAGVPWNEQIGRILMGIAIADKNPAGLLQYGEYLKKLDAAKEGQLSDPGTQQTLGMPGGAEALQDAGVRVPQPRPIEQLIGATSEGPKADPNRTYNTVAAPSKPGDPTTAAYNLPLTPTQLAARGTRDLYDALDQNFSTLQYEKTVGIGPHGPTATVKERDLGVVAVPRDLVEGTNYADHGFRLTPTNRVDGRGVPIVTLDHDPAYEAARTTSATEATKLPYQLGQEQRAETRTQQGELRGLQQKYPGAVVEQAGTLARNPDFPGTAAAESTQHMGEAKQRAAIENAQKQWGLVLAAKDNQQFITGVADTFNAAIKALPEDYPQKFERSLGGALSSVGSKIRYPGEAWLQLEGSQPLVNLQSLSAGLLTMVGRHFGEKQAFTDRDAARFAKTLPAVGDSTETMRTKTKQLVALVSEIADRATAIDAGKPFQAGPGETLLTGNDFVTHFGGAGNAAPAPNAQPTPGGMSDTERRLRERLSGR